MIYKKTLPWKNLLDIPQGLIDSDKDGVFENLKLPWEGVQNKPSAYRPYDAIYIPKNPIAYFKDSLVDVLRGIKPESYDESTITDYGLRTATDADGNPLLVVTERMDDTPFPGVKSFAVEEGTENLLTNPSFETGDTSGWQRNLVGNGTIEIVPMAWYGSYAARISCSTGNHNWLDQTYTTTAHGTYTLSAYIKLERYNSGVIGITLKAIYDDGSKDFAHSEIDYTRFNEWQRISVTLTTDTSKNLTKVVAYAPWSNSLDGTFIGDAVQLEQKPFATSFVDGTRVDGRWKLTNILPTSPDNLVIAFWLNIHPNQFLSNPDCEIMNSMSSSNTDGALGIKGIKNTATSFKMVVWHYADDGYGTKILNTNEWHFIVYIRDGLNSKLYVDGEKDIDFFTQDQINISGHLGLGFSGDPVIDSKKSNYKISNLYIGKAKDSSGNLIWTDDYIRQVYELQRPFII